MGDAAGVALAPGGGVIVGGSSFTRPNQASYYRVYDCLLVKYVEPPTIMRNPEGSGYRVDLPVFPGRIFTLQRAASPTGPWVDLEVRIAPASGRFISTDLNPLSGSAFYRVQSQ